MGVSLLNFVHSRVAVASLAGVVSARQLLVEEAAEDVAALAQSAGRVQEQVSGSQSSIDHKEAATTYGWKTGPASYLR